MSPIKDLSDVVRLPRLGKIHLGVKHPEKGYPMKTDYFVFPKEHPSRDALVKLFGEKPKELRILIPVEDEETWCSQYYRAYNMTQGLICKGDGEKALRMVDDKTGDITSSKTETVRLRDITCEGKNCLVYKEKKCKETMNLRFLIPEAPGLGIWQIDTGSINSILNINSCAALIRSAFKRISLIPLSLTLEPQEVNNPETGKKQTVYVMNLRTNITIAELAGRAREQAQTLLLAPLEDFDPADYWDDGAAKSITATVEPTSEATKPPASPLAPTPAPESSQQEVDKSDLIRGEHAEMATGKLPNGIEVDWLTEQIGILQKRAPRTWDETSIVAWMVKTYQVEGKTIFECAGKLKHGAATHFVSRIESDLALLTRK